MIREALSSQAFSQIQHFVRGKIMQEKKVRLPSSLYPENLVDFLLEEVIFKNYMGGGEEKLSCRSGPAIDEDEDAR